MRTTRNTLAIDPREFGRRLPMAAAIPVPASGLGEDLRLFAVTFAAGFLFVSILIA